MTHIDPMWILILIQYSINIDIDIDNSTLSILILTLLIVNLILIFLWFWSLILILILTLWSLCYLWFININTLWYCYSDSLFQITAMVFYGEARVEAAKAPRLPDRREAGKGRGRWWCHPMLWGVGGREYTLCSSMFHVRYVTMSNYESTLNINGNKKIRSNCVIHFSG